MRFLADFLLCQFTTSAQFLAQWPIMSFGCLLPLFPKPPRLPSFLFGTFPRLANVSRIASCLFRFFSFLMLFSFYHFIYWPNLYAENILSITDNVSPFYPRRKNFRSENDKHLCENSVIFPLFLPSGLNTLSTGIIAKKSSDAIEHQIRIQ